jgi:hypothetical protein
MIKKNISWLSIFVLLLSIGKISAQSETSQKDSTKVKKATKELPLERQGNLRLIQKRLLGFLWILALMGKK